MSQCQPVDVTDNVLQPSSDVTCCDSDTTTQGDKQDVTPKHVTVDMSQDGVTVDNESVGEQGRGDSEGKREDTEARDDMETEVTQLSPCLLGSTRKISPQGEQTSGLPSKPGGYYRKYMVLNMPCLFEKRICIRVHHCHLSSTDAIIKIQI